MEGDYHFDATPLAPPGSKMLMHQKPGSKRTWGANAEVAWYVGPCPTHYRTFTGVLPNTGGERKSNSVKFKHHVFPTPELTPEDRILEATRELKDVLRHQPKNAPLKGKRGIALIEEVMQGKDVDIPLNSVKRRRLD